MFLETLNLNKTSPQKYFCLRNRQKYGLVKTLGGLTAIFYSTSNVGVLQNGA